MEIRSKGKRIVTPYNNFYRYGVYVWQLEDGKIVADEDGNYLSIQSDYGNPKRIRELEAAARHYGVPDGGHPLFLPGHRKVTDVEYEQQKERMNSGLIPDPYDLPAFTEPRNDN